MNSVLTGVKNRVEDGDGWSESTWLFPHIVQLLQIPEYRTCLLQGFVLSIGSRNESTVSHGHRRDLL
jgi:hypothetical protein